jgi:hypothetical protein
VNGLLTAWCSTKIKTSKSLCRESQGIVYTTPALERAMPSEERQDAPNFSASNAGWVHGPELLGANKTTAKYAGGGALAGALIGARAGGGKSATIGTVAGGAAGAGTWVLTAGKSIKIPAETVLTFKTAQPLQLRPASQENER